jgi:hypothetical protein
MCNGEGDEASQSCERCKTSDGCSKSTSDKFQTLHNCYSGTVSNDATVCMATYTNPLQVTCERGEYQVCFIMDLFIVYVRELCISLQHHEIDL